MGEVQPFHEDTSTAESSGIASAFLNQGNNIHREPIAQIGLDGFLRGRRRRDLSSLVTKI